MMGFGAGARVRNLSSTIRHLLKLASLVAGMAASTTFVRLTAAERQAIMALKAAIDAVLALLPIPGEDNDPSTPG